jgi:hypothetical protein
VTFRHCTRDRTYSSLEFCEAGFRASRYQPFDDESNLTSQKYQPARNRGHAARYRTRRPGPHHEMHSHLADQIDTWNSNAEQRAEQKRRNSATRFVMADRISASITRLIIQR